MTNQLSFISLPSSFLHHHLVQNPQLCRLSTASVLSVPKSQAKKATQPMTKQQDTIHRLGCFVAQHSRASQLLKESCLLLWHAQGPMHCPNCSPRTGNLRIKSFSTKVRAICRQLDPRPTAGLCTVSTVPSESIHTHRLFPHFFVLQPEYKFDYNWDFVSLPIHNNAKVDLKKNVYKLIKN